MRFNSLSAPFALATLAGWLAVAPAPAATAGSGTGSSPASVSPIPGAKVVERSTRGFDEYWIPLGRLTGDGQAVKNELLEGKWTHHSLAGPPGRSVAEVTKHYEQVLSKAGMEVVYACKGVDCGEGGRKTNGDWWALSDNRRFLVARMQRPEGDVWVSVHVHARSATAPVEHELDVVETKTPTPPPPPRDESDVATLAKELEADGRVVLRSLGFVEGRATVLPESQGVVQAIAELLARDPGLRLHVVVHSDYATPAASGLDLTKKRASAIVNTLARQHGVRSGRIHAAGLGPLAPVASNETEEGRAMNRRVELVREGVDRVRASAVGRDR